MFDDLLARIDRTLANANHSGALQPIRTESTPLTDGDFEFTVRWVSSLAHKDAARVSAAVRRDPAFNPFLPPDPELTVGPLGDRHLGVLNKFPVISRHLLIVTREFEEQTAPLSDDDFDVWAGVIDALGGLGFYNGGAEGGASQRHKHLQWIPEQADGTRPTAFTDELPAAATGTPVEHPRLPWRQRSVRLAGCTGAALRRAFGAACGELGIDPHAERMPPYNLLVTRRWLTLIPRSHEHHEGISVNALGFAGSLFVRRPEQIDIVRRLTPLQLLAAVATARHGRGD